MSWRIRVHFSVDVNRKPSGGGVSEDRTHTAPSGTWFNCRNALLSSTVVILSGGPSGSSASSSGWAFLFISLLRKTAVLPQPGSYFIGRRFSRDCFFHESGNGGHQFLCPTGKNW